MNKNILTSWGYLFRGTKMLFHPKLRIFVLAPLLINIIIFSILIALGAHYFQDLIAWIDNFLPTWLHWLNWLMWILFSLATIVVLAFSFTIIANLVAAPFNSFLAEKAEQLLTNKVSTVTFAETIKDIPRILKHEALKILYYLPRAILFLILFIIPILQIAAPVLWFLFNSWMMSLQYLDYPMDNHKLSVKEIRTKMGSEKLANIGFGTTVMLASMVPIINLIVIPSAVVGATIFWVERYRSK